MILLPYLSRYGRVAPAILGLSQPSDKRRQKPHRARAFRRRLSCTAPDRWRHRSTAKRAKRTLHLVTDSDHIKTICKN